MLHQFVSFILCLIFSGGMAFADYDDKDFLDLINPDDERILEEDPVEEKRNSLQAVELNLSEREEIDDLDSLREDIGEIYFEDTNVELKKIEGFLDEDTDGKELKGAIKARSKEELEQKDPGGTIVNEFKDGFSKKDFKIFDVGKEEKELLKLARFIQKKIPSSEWEEIASASSIDKYTVVEGDYLWKISQRLFGSGFYYPKIWSLNPFITNPHEVEPGMTLIFTTGDEDAPPEVRMGSFGGGVTFKGSTGSKEKIRSFDQFGDEAEPPWIKEKKELLQQGVFVQYSTEDTYESLEDAAATSKITEYRKYQPPEPKLKVYEDNKTVEVEGFDKYSKVINRFKEGFFLNTFVTTNVVQDFGEVVNARTLGIAMTNHMYMYVKFDPTLQVSVGDKYSIYKGKGVIQSDSSDRDGYAYEILGSFKVLRKISDKWECMVIDSPSMIQRGDRVTVYTPRISQIVENFNQRQIEAAVIDVYKGRGSMAAVGEVVYLDRGRADGLQIGNVMEAYTFRDEGVDKKISYNPTYKIGEIVVINLTDNFATGLVKSVSDVVQEGTLVVTKSKEQAARDARIKNKSALFDVKRLERKALDELDVELNLDDVSDDLLDKADKIKLSEDELEELERQERERSIIKEGERDLKALERLEDEIESAEKQLNEAKVDEDKILEQESLNKIEKAAQDPNKNAFESLNQIEKDIGKKYLDEDLNSKENPYGLTEIDLEEIDELLNLDVE